MITKDLSYAATLLCNDGIIGLPTETVYGLAANAFSDQAVRKIFSLKKRPLSNPLIVHIPSVFSLSEVAKDIPDMALRLAARFWPGPLTLVLRKNDRIPQVVTSGQTTVAVRVPDHPIALSLLNLLSFPLAAPSANPFGSISPTTAQHVEDYFGDFIGCVVDGGYCSRGLESTIVGFPDGRPVLYRLGAIAEEEIRAVCPGLIIQTKTESIPLAPGMFDRHYSPCTPLTLTNSISGWAQQEMVDGVGFLSFGALPLRLQAYPHEILSMCGDMQEAARNLYAAMHRLDSIGLRLIVAETLPDHGLGRSMNDRLKRAVASAADVSGFIHHAGD